MLLNFFFAVTNKKPSHVSITKVKQFPGSSSFAKRSMWTIDQLRQVNGCDPNKVSLQFPEPPCRGLSFSWLHDLAYFIRANPISTPSALFMLVRYLSCSVSVSLSIRTVQSLTWHLTMPLTSGWLARPAKSAPLSRSSTTPASATALRASQSLSTVSPNCWEVRDIQWQDTPSLSRALSRFRYLYESVRASVLTQRFVDWFFDF